MTEPFKPTLVRNMLIVAAFFSVLAVVFAAVAYRQFSDAFEAIEAKEARGK